MQKLVWKNSLGDEIDLTSGSYGITEWEGFSNTSLNIQSQQVPFQDGGVFLDALIEQRELSVTLKMQDNGNLEERYRMRRELIHILNPKLGEGYLIYTNDFTSKRIKCVAQIPLFETHNSNDSGTPKASLAWTACEPYWEDLEETVVSVLGFQEVENNGDIPCQVKIQLPTNIENPMIMNQTNNKIISLQGLFTNDTLINTNVGEKNVKSQKLNVDVILGRTFNDMLYKDGYIYYVGEGIVRENIITGEKENINNTYFLNRLIYANNLFVGVGENYIVTSQDGYVWNEVLLLGQYDYFNDIAFGNNQFVAIGYNFENFSYGIVYTSPNGTEWTQVSIENFSRPNGIAFGNNIFVIQGGTNLKSTDGINWVEFERFSGNRGRIRYVNNKFYATGNTIMTSLDGNIWTQIYTSTTSLRDINYINDTVIAVGNDGTILTTKNEVNWEVQNRNTTENFVCVIPVENITYIAGGQGSIINSADNEEWFIKSKKWEYRILNDITFGNDRFVAIGQNKIIMISLDGIKWQEIYKENTGSLYAIIYAKGLFVTVGSNGIIKTSKDGINWTTQQIGTSNYGNINYVRGQFLIYTENNKLLISVDGYNWVEDTTTKQVTSLTYAKEKYIGVADSGYIGKSIDGKNWTQIEDLPNNINYSKVIYAKGLFVIVGQISGSVGNVVIATSSNGEYWDIKYFEVETSEIDISYGENIFVVVCSGFLLSSLDGKNWKTQTSLAPATGIAYGLKKFISIRNKIAEIYFTNIENNISKLTSNSDMTFNLEIGTNVLYCNLTKQITLSFRQKYIGV